MENELCQPCKEAGFSILAHYKAIPKGASHDGKEHPAMCWDHKHGKVPRHISGKVTPEEPKPKALNIHDVDLSKVAPAPVQKKRLLTPKKCWCGCGTTFTPTGYKQKYAPGHRPDREPKGPKEPKEPKVIRRGQDETLPAAINLPPVVAQPLRQVSLEHHTRTFTIREETRAVGALGELEAMREKLLHDLEAVETVIALWNRA